MRAEQLREIKTFCRYSFDSIDWDKLDMLQGSQKVQMINLHLKNGVYLIMISRTRFEWVIQYNSKPLFEHDVMSQQE